MSSIQYQLEKSAPPELLGFVVARKIDDFGYCGGYLILNQDGHPIEFHCSLPIQPSRTHEILYGDRIDEFVLGHKIVPALLSKSKIEPQAILFASTIELTIKSTLKYPVVVVSEIADKTAQELAVPANNTSSQISDCSLPSDNRFEDWKTTRLNLQLEFSCPQGFDCGLILAYAAQFAIDEPFARIEQALSEAQSKAAA